MRLQAYLGLLIAVHLGCGVGQMTVSYWGSGVADYGATNNPLMGDVSTDLQVQEDVTRLEIVVDTIDRFTGPIKIIFTYQYPFLVMLQQEEGFVGYIGWLSQLAFAMLMFAFLATCVYTLFDSGMLTSTTGIAVLATGGLLATGTAFWPSVRNFLQLSFGQ